MAQTDELVEALKSALRARGITYAMLAGRLELSESSVKRMFARANFTLRRLEEICAAAELDLTELALRADERQRDVEELSEEQERTLVSDPKLLLVAFLLLNFRTVDYILGAYRIEPLEMVRLLAKLDRMRIIDLLPGNQVRVRLSRTFSWRRGGPIERLFESTVQNEFFDSHFDGPGELRLVLNGMITDQSLAALHERMQRIAAEFDDCVRHDRVSVAPHTLLSTMVLAIRPWTMSMFETLRKDPSEPGR